MLFVLLTLLQRELLSDPLPPLACSSFHSILRKKFLEINFLVNFSHINKAKTRKRYDNDVRSEPDHQTYFEANEAECCIDVV